MQSITDFWKKLTGDNQLSDNNRTINAVLCVSLAFLVPSTIINILVVLVEPLIINCLLIVIFCILYQFSRFRKAHKPCFVAYGMCCYIALIATFFYNAGTKGPVLFLFVITFYLLIAISPQKQHVLWTLMHIIVGFSLMYIEFYYPASVKGHYISKWGRFYDIAFTYVISLFFLYLITIYPRKKYEQERKTANKQARLVMQKSSVINSQSNRLKEVASIQSLEVRAQVATILGLAQMIDTGSLADNANNELLKNIVSAAQKLEETIRS